MDFLWYDEKRDKNPCASRCLTEANIFVQELLESLRPQKKTSRHIPECPRQKVKKWLQGLEGIVFESKEPVLTDTIEEADDEREEEAEEEDDFFFPHSPTATYYGSSDDSPASDSVHTASTKLEPELQVENKKKALVNAFGNKAKRRCL